MIHFSERLKDLRIQKNISMYDLSVQLGVSNAAICKWENELTEPKASNIKSIAEFFEVSTDYLLGLEDDFGIKKYSAPQIVVQNISQKENDMLLLFRLLPSDLQKRASDYLQKLVNLTKEEEIIFNPNKKQKNI